ncbi:type II toxin-antitoxin system death-on-curing family toxin [Enterococcus avium]|uniref:type II toxin-antitoxin system death-on-curing family toxin n=1 Tax=Enterococcus avium TaxID=33945 RepID=UPI001F61F78B|nr:type II toxin-antitoxin system death-on-curing family toxin [Enterococcus avium]MBO1141886.1 type II toxin-antitoxin system death-on-curing family toxin [Enterococcus avium]
MEDKINYFEKDHAIKEHDKIINISGGLHGIKDVGMLESMLEFIQNDLYYPSFLDKLNQLVVRTARFHIFMDGNKRTSIVLGAYFLKINGFTSDVIDYFIVEMENIVVLLVDRALTEEDFYDLLGLIISGAPYPESMQLVLYNAYTTFAENEKVRGEHKG